jgi:class 3 adenylate cyclase
MDSLRWKNLLEPDERREAPFADLRLTRVGSMAIGHGVLEPGWRWSTHMGPIMGTPSCPIHHVQLVISGRIAYRMDDGQEVELGPNDLVDVPPGHDAWVVGEEPAVLLDIGGNIAGIAVPQEHERVLATILMTDIVGSTAIAERLGDQQWKQLLAEHDRVVRALLTRFRGTEVKTVGDGFVTTFASPAAALRCGIGIADDVRALGLEVRVGVHTGEIELTSSDIAGISVHVAARILSLAGPSQVLLSASTRALAEATGLRFEEHGRHAVKGVERPVEVFRLVA